MQALRKEGEDHQPNAIQASASYPRRSSRLSLQLDDLQMVAEAAKKKDKPSRNDYSEGLGLVYCIVLVLCGIIFPVTEALQDEWLRTVYNLIFQLYLHIVAIVFLCYLQFYLLRHQDEEKHEQKDSPFNLVATLHRDEDGVVTLSNKNEEGLQPVFYVGENGTQSNVDLETNQKSRHESAISEEEETTWIDLSSIGSIFDHEGSNLFLRFGTLIFGLGNLIYVGLELEHVMLERPEGCKKQTYGWAYIFRLLFVLVQTFFLFKNSKVHVHHHQPLCRLGYHHLIATNICIWVRTLTSEILEEYLHSLHHNHDNDTHVFRNIPHGSEAYDDPSVGTMAECLVYTGVLVIVSPYLFPFVLEYSLIAMGTVSIFLVELNDLSDYGSSRIVKGLHNLIKVPKFVTIGQAGAEGEESDDDGKAYHNDGVDVSKSNSGIFLGIVVLAGVIVSTILFFFEKDNERHETDAQLIYLISDLSIHGLMLIATIVGLFKLHTLAFINKPMSVDDVLLLVSMAGAVLFELSIMVSTGTIIDQGNDDYIQILTFVNATVAAVQTLLQVMLSLSGLRRYPANKNQVRDMPGRGTLSFLIIANVSTWIFRSMQTKKSGVYVSEDFYGIIAWLLISNINLPLLLFYRFHSSVCLADIWHTSYVPLTKKLEHSSQPGHEALAAISSRNSKVDVRQAYENNNYQPDDQQANVYL